MRVYCIYIFEFVNRFGGATIKFMDKVVAKKIVSEERESHFSKMKKLIQKHPFTHLKRPVEDIL